MTIVVPRLTACHQKGLQYVFGNGNTLEFRDLTSKSVKKLKVFAENACVIYGIVLDLIDDEGIFCFGERELAWIKDYNVIYQLKLDDWISAVSVLGNGDVVVLTSKNIVRRYSRKNGNELELVDRVELESLGLLFCAVISGSNWDDLSLYCGNVFGDVVLFRHLDGSWKSTVFKGHKGMIFGLTLTTTHLYSISDDRTLTVWDRYTGEMLSQGYGHSARPLSITVASDSRIFTGGYDEMICVWEFDKELVLKHSIQLSGGPIRSLVTVDDKLIVGTATGTLIEVTVPMERYAVTENKLGFLVRSFCRVSEDATVYINESRELIKYDEQGSSVLLSSSPLKFNTLVKMPEGAVIVAEEHKLHYIYSLEKPQKMKIEVQYSIVTLVVVNQYVLISDEHEQCHIFKAEKGQIKEVGVITIPSRHRISSGFVFGNIMVMGTTKGTVMVIDQHDFAVLETIPKAHKKESILNITAFGGSIVSMGKDGYVATWTYDKKLELISVKGTIEWPCKVIKQGNEVYLIGFHADKFVVINMETYLTEAEAPCGGGHRIWEYNAKENLLEYIQKGELYTAKCNLTKMKCLEGPYHSSESTCLTVVKDTSSLEVNNNIIRLVTGGNDTKVILYEYDSSIDEIRVLQTSERPLSSVHNIASSGKYVFTVGGRGEIIVWKVEDDQLIYVCSKCFSNDFRLISVDVQQEQDGQYMISVLEANAVITILHFSEDTKTLTEVNSFGTEETWSYVAIKMFDNRVYAVNTIGELIVYENTQEVSKIKIEQNSLSTLNLEMVKEDHFLIIGSVSGTLTVVKVQGIRMKVVAQSIQHASTVTDIDVEVKEGGLELISVSLDRRMVISRYDDEKKALNVSRITCLTTADPSSVVKVENLKTVLIAGYGLETVKL
ncbi:unnamed protein product [Bursaphelenchus okinawaensis]|uniref:tRNA (34-2'-O)-methyltransferase regulator WDR6 n=1 Tax=Bursaphelenchus okinawaensis TaxID=465554 RepID=A0A811LJC7_9BILA|nr:unnamed protein product [Bursaphelenchus okinawaensis]CAG9124263.1 unnamed protein product [Bursaphelenchus okinawaensis]